MSYSRILAHYPYVVLAAVGLFAATCLVVVVTIGKRPDFSDPKLGFEARGTTISDRMRSYDLLLEKTQSNQIPKIHHFVSTLPTQIKEEAHVAAPTTNLTHRLKLKSQHDEDWQEGDLLYPGVHNATQRYFCDVPRKEYGRLAYAASGDEAANLWSVEHLQAMCTLESELLSNSPTYSTVCVRTTVSRQCCRSASLPNYVAMLSNHTTCSDLTGSDVTRVGELLIRCQAFYPYQLKATCYSDELGDYTRECDEAPRECQKFNAIYYILRYLTDIRFMAKKAGHLETKLTYVMSFLPVAASIASQPLYQEIVGGQLDHNGTKVIAINFGIKHVLFDYYLQKDTLWLGLSLLAIFLTMWLYTESLFLTIMTIISMILSLIITYFLYTMVFEISFTPFMNLLAVIILLGVGADDVFIYSRVWTLAKLEKNAGTLEKIVSDTLRHASLSMFVTSLTTAAAFYANYVSPITALRCFAVFSGTIILTNFIMMVTWIPASIVLHEKWISQWCVCPCTEKYTNHDGCMHKFVQVYRCLVNGSRIFFEKVLPWIIVRVRYFWLLLFALLGLAGIIIVFYYPKLKLPSSNEFQVFAQDHPFEMYDFKIKDQFSFEKAAGSSIPDLPITVVWGVKAQDSGNKLNPFDKGSLKYEESFNIAKPESQTWLYKFCRDIRSLQYYQPQSGIHFTNCFIESFRVFMNRGCYDIDDNNLDPCCQISKFPYTEVVFHQCLGIWLPLLAKTSTHLYNVNDAGVRFSKETGNLVSVVVEFTSKEPFSFNYGQMEEFYSNLNQWVDNALVEAPKEMQGGWFVSHLAFFDLQRSIAQGTPVAIGVSIAVTTVVAFLTTLNVFITLYAILSIAGTIFVTVGSLVLMGWELNILESFTISVAIGLSIDFTLHYGMAYRLSPDLDREMRVVCGTGRMGSPVAVAALTTFLAGLFMLPSTVLAYKQLGYFLMLVMSISWLYATLFYQSLLRSMGPQGGFGQFHWPSFDMCEPGGREHVDKTVYAMSESTLSSSSTNHANSSEVHELEPLTDHDGHPREVSRHHHHHHHPLHRLRGSRHHPSPGHLPAPTLRQNSVDSVSSTSNLTFTASTSHVDSEVGSLSSPSVSSAQTTPKFFESELHTPKQNKEEDEEDEDEEEEDSNHSSCTQLLDKEKTKSAVFDSNRNSCDSDVWIKQNQAM